MIGLNTNVLVRYLVQDDPIQSQKATNLVETSVKSGNHLWICQVTLCETIWVLQKCYKLTKEEVCHILHQLLSTPQILVENDDVAWLALLDFERNKKIGFVDFIIGRQNFEQGMFIDLYAR